MSCLSASGFFPRAYFVQLALGDKSYLANPNPTFARLMPVPRSGAALHKYIVFQSFANAGWSATINQKGPRQRNPHIR